MLLIIQNGYANEENVAECNFDSFANVVSTSDAIHLLRNIHRHALQYSIDMLMLFSSLL